MSSESILYSPYNLPCGVTVRNRLVKAAMEENMSSMGNLPGESLYALLGARAVLAAALLTGILLFRSTTGADFIYFQF